MKRKREEIEEDLETKSKKKKKEKRKGKLNMDVDVSLRREIEKQEQQDYDQHSQEENPHAENIQGEKKRSKNTKEKKMTEEPDMEIDVSLLEKQEQQEDLHSQEEYPHTEKNKGEKKKKEKKRKEEPNMDFDLTLLTEIEKQQEKDQHFEGGNLHAELNKGEKKMSKKKKKKKRKEEPNMDFDVSLHREIKKEQEKQGEDLHYTENNMGEKKRSKKKKEKKMKEETDQHSDEGNLLRENSKGEEKRSKKEEEKAETSSQKIPTQSSCADHEQRKVKEAQKLLHLAKENGMDKDHTEGVVYEDKKMAKKTKQAEDILCKSVDEECSNRFVNKDENASSKATKHSKKSRRSVQRRGYNPASNDDLLSNNIECTKEPLTDQIEHVTNTSVAIDSSLKENEKEKKKERKRKRVTFQDQINVADQEHVREIPNAACENSKDTVEEVWGVRFTPEEDEILKDAVWTYIKSKGWDEQEGLNKVFNSLKHKDARNCWADIKLCLPHRPRQAIRYRAHLLLEKGAHAGKWSEEEEQLLKRLQGQHGRKWKEISSLLDRHRTSIKEKYRSLKRTKGKGKGQGVWTQGELQQLSDMVHRCLRARVSVEKKKPDRHILRDDINWEKIADTIGTHNHGSCCGKWYYNLQSSLVTDGHWANEDDLLLLQSLLESGACVEEEVEWDSLLDHRPGQVCSTRWKQMVKHLGENRTRQFLDKLDILARRYAPELVES